MTRARRCTSYRADGEQCRRGGTWVAGQATVTDCYQHVIARARDDRAELITNLRTMRTLRVEDIPGRAKPRRRPHTREEFIRAFGSCDDARALHKLIVEVLEHDPPIPMGTKLVADPLRQAIGAARIRCRAIETRETQDAEEAVS